MRKRIRRKTMFALAAAIGALSLTACQGGTHSGEILEPGAVSQESTEVSAKGNVGEASEDGSSWAAPETAGKAAAAEQTEPLVVYLNDFDGVIVHLFKEATGYDVEVVVGNGAETMSRVAAEQGNPQWDVLWLDSMYDVYQLSRSGELLSGWEPENAANLTEFAKGLVPENQCMYPTGTHAAGVLVYRNDVFSEEDAPASFAELTDEKYRDQIGMADPGVAAPAYPLAAYFMDSLGMDEGKKYFNTLFEHGLKVYPKNPQVVQALASGEISVALLQETNAYEMAASGEPITIVWPQEGAPGSVRVAAISADTDQEEIAKAFVNFLLDAKTQQALINTGDEGYFEPSVKGVTQKDDRDEKAVMKVAGITFGSEKEGEIKAWFADMSAQGQ